jgi:hypothetical protein
MRRCALALGLVLAVLVAGCNDHSSAGSTKAPAAKPAASGGGASEGVPLIESGRLAQPWERGGLRWGVPPDGEPAVDAAAAVAAVRHKAPREATQVSAVYATLTDAQRDAVPVWLVTYADVCVPIIGGPAKPGQAASQRSAPECYQSPMVSIVNATTGKWIMSFADGHTDPGTMIAR